MAMPALGGRKRAPMPRLLVSSTQRVLFSLEQFSRHEMANHAAAGAYSFLLSAVPAMLVIVYLSSIAAVNLDTSMLVKSIGPYLAAFGGDEALRAFTVTPLSGFAGAFGLLNLIWAARLFIISIQRGVRVVYSSEARVDPIRENILTFAVELVVIVAVVLIIAVSQVARTALAVIHWAPAAVLFGFLVRISLHAFPILALWTFVFFTYLNIPPHKPRTGNAVFGATMCTIAYVLFGALLGLTLNTERYGLLYGILGNLIVGLIKVYFFFWLYFFFMELCYTLEFFDSLLFARFHQVTIPEKRAGKVERALFAEPDRLFRRYAREYKAGQTIFAKGDQEKTAYYLYRGSVGIYLAPPDNSPGSKLSQVAEGEFFGEMAGILEEPRSAWAIAITDCTVFILPPEMFKRFLGQDPTASIRFIELLSSRLKANNEYLSRTGKQ
jgi:membrane protein